MDLKNRIGPRTCSIVFYVCVFMLGFLAGSLFLIPAQVTSETWPAVYLGTLFFASANCGIGFIGAELIEGAIGESNPFALVLATPAVIAFLWILAMIASALIFGVCLSISHLWAWIAISIGTCILAHLLRLWLNQKENTHG